MDAADPRYGEMSALYRVASLSIAHGDITEVMNEVVRVVASTIACEKAALFLFDRDSDELILYSSTDGRTRMRMALQDSPFLSTVFLHRTPQLSNDVGRDSEGGVVLETEFGARQLVASPLGVGDSNFGVLAAVNSSRGAFTEADLKLLTIVADRAALTIENARLVATLQRQVGELEGLQRLTKLLTSTEDVEKVVGESLRIVSDLIECEKMALLLHDRDMDLLVVLEPVVGMTAAEIEGLKIPLSEPSLGSTVFRTNTPLISNEARTDAWVSPRFRELLNIDTLMVAPLGSGPKPIGILKAVNANKGYFDDDDLRLMNLLSGRLGSVLEASQARGRERSLVRRLQEADRTKTEFVGMLAHELRGPMTTITGFAYALRDQGDALPDEKKGDILGIIVRETERLSRLVNDLLDVSRMESGTLSYDFGPVALEELVHGILEVHTSLRANHVVDERLPEQLPKVLIDRDRISQVLINLLTNATRYSPEGTEIEIGAQVTPNGDQVEVTVADRGIGVPADDRDRIFEKFAMLPKPAWVKKGTGLGLFITKGIIEAHGGRIWVDSDIGRGTTFHFTLPVARDSGPAPI